MLQETHDWSERQAGMKQLRRLAMTPTPMYIKVAFTMVDDMRPARDRFTTVDAAKREEEKSDSTRTVV